MPGDVRQLDRSAAHRSTQFELLVTRMRRRSETDWEVDLSLPRSHWLCHPTPDVVPLTLLAEALRQAGLAVCVAGLAVDPTVHFIISSLSIHAHGAPLSFPRFGALERIASVSFSEVTYRKGLPHRFEVDYEIGDDVSAHISAQALAPRDYRAVRRNTPLLDETIVEREESLLLDTTISANRAEARLGVNEADPFFFDHPVDHLPGMLLLHAAAALHKEATGDAAESLTISFPAFAELRTPTLLSAAIDGDASRTTVVQDERVIAEVLIESADEPVVDDAAGL